MRSCRLTAICPPRAIGDAIEFDDDRGRSRRLIVRARDGAALIAELDRTAYMASGTVLRFDDSVAMIGEAHCRCPADRAEPVPQKGDTLLLTPDSLPGRLAIRDHEGRLAQPASIGITLPEVFRDVRPGEPIWFDDGKIGGVVARRGCGTDCRGDHACAPERGEAGRRKGHQSAGHTLRLAALTAKDTEDLAFVAAHADLVAILVRSPGRGRSSVAAAAGRAARRQVGIVLKIETRQAFNELPALLLAAMRGERFGVMIARGDLAVECGFERMAEVQEEILWICEAAHTPVIWATQVLESLAKTGLPSRAEVTDAAMSERAECVMLNKGPFVREAVATLDDILRRMEAHQSKRRAMLRPLHVAHAVSLDLSTPPIHVG